MVNILVIQSRKRPDMVAIEQEEYTRAVGDRAALSFISSLDENLQWNKPEKILEGFQGVIFGGSGDFDFDGGRDKDDEARLTAHAIRDRLRPFVEYLFSEGIPTLGICFGHQIIGELRGSTVVNDVRQKKVGTHGVVLTEEGKKDPLFSLLPERLDAQYGHKDSLSRLPLGAVLLATGAGEGELCCEYSALRYGTSVYTVQFHPELGAEDMKRRFALSPGYLPEGISPDSLVRESHEASSLIGLFLGRVAQASDREPQSAVAGVSAQS